MALDVYLDARWSLSPVLAEDRKACAVIASAIGYQPPLQRPGNRALLLEVNAVSVSVGHWQDMPPLCDWLQDHLQQSLIGVECAVDGNVLEALEQAILKASHALESPECTSLSKVPESELRYSLEVITAARRLREAGWELFTTAWC